MPNTAPCFTEEPSERQRGRNEVLAILSEKIGEYRALKDFAPDNAVRLYAHGILSVLELVHARGKAR